MCEHRALCVSPKPVLAPGTEVAAADLNPRLFLEVWNLGTACQSGSSAGFPAPSSRALPHGPSGLIPRASLGLHSC